MPWRRVAAGSGNSGASALVLLAGNESNSDVAIFGVQPSGGGGGPQALRRLQTLYMRSSAKGAAQFFGHLLAVPAAGLVVLASASSKSVYVAHLTGARRPVRPPPPPPRGALSLGARCQRLTVRATRLPCTSVLHPRRLVTSSEPAHKQMGAWRSGQCASWWGVVAGGDDARGPGFDYMTEFAVAMPVLTVAAVDGDWPAPAAERPVVLFAVQSTAIQQYALDPALCMPPAATTAAPSATPLTPR